MPAEVRPVAAGESTQVVTLVCDVLAEFGLTFGQGAKTDAELFALPGSYRAHGGEFWVAFDGPTLLGTCGMFPVAPGTFELRKMYLAPASRGLGIGQKLFDAALAWVRAHGGRRIVLDTTEKMTRAIAFYEKNGFVRDDTEIRGSRCSRGYARDLTIG